ncbi:PREDICTED: uncharacterized protein LOC104817122 [Tarenaya hassleriana]|uniref:uncharacterized protein LOC104817122 n=1 Tax=Tarenaya hassleriana TaxID=28532 RepID=UPI00053C14AF|nr:PREDICTED: uncharacterized protein LOC104817122 [Tarenaya hassleriana]
MEEIFEDYKGTELRKVQYAESQLIGDAFTWWKREEIDRRRARYDPVTTWKKMKILMRRRYVPQHFLRELRYKFRNIVQGKKTVEGYFREFEQLLAYLRIDDNEEDLMAHFLEGLKDRIARKVNPHVYRDLRHLVHTAIQVERQMNKKLSKNGCQRTPTPMRIPEKLSNTGDPMKAQNLDARKDETILYKREVHTRGNKTSSSCTYFTSEVPCSECRNQSHLPSGSSIRQEVSIKDNGAYHSIALAVGRHLEDDFEVPSDKETKSVTEKKETVENPGFVTETKPKSLANVSEERQYVKENAFVVTSNKKEYDAKESEDEKPKENVLEKSKAILVKICKDIIEDSNNKKATKSNDEADKLENVIVGENLNEVKRDIGMIRLDWFEQIEVTSKKEIDGVKVVSKPLTMLDDTSNNRTCIISQKLGATGNFVPTFILVYDSCFDEYVMNLEQQMRTFQTDYLYKVLKGCTYYTNEIVVLDLVNCSQVLDFHERVKEVHKEAATCIFQAQILHVVSIPCQQLNGHPNSMFTLMPMAPKKDAPFERGKCTNVENLIRHYNATKTRTHIWVVFLTPRALRGNFVLIFILIYDHCFYEHLAHLELLNGMSQKKQFNESTSCTNMFVSYTPNTEPQK